MDFQVWREFLEQNWLVIVVALVVIFLVLNFVKTLIKWALVIVIAAFVIIYSGISLNDITDAVTTVKNEFVDISKSEALKMMKNEAKEAKLTQNEDGTYKITSPNFEITGTFGSDKAKVMFKGVTLGEWQMNETLEAFIQEAKRGSQ